MQEIISSSNFLEAYPSWRAKIVQNISKYYEDEANISSAEAELKSLVRPKEVEVPDGFPWFGLLIILTGILILVFTDWLDGWLGWIIFAIGLIKFLGRFYRQSEYEVYVEELRKYESRTRFLNENISRLKDESPKLIPQIQADIYTVINSGLSIPIADDAPSIDNFNQLIDWTDTLYSEYKEMQTADNPELKNKLSRIFYDKKLEFIYDVSMKAESNSEVYKIFEDQLKQAKESDDMNILRTDGQEKSILATHKYEFYGTLDTFATRLPEMNLSEKVLEDYEAIKDEDVTNAIGITSVDLLSAKTEKLRAIYEDVKVNFDELQTMGNEINYWLTFARTVAYRNIYLGVEYLNYIRDNAGGKSLSAQKDVVSTNKEISVKGLDVNLNVNTISNISSSFSMLADQLDNKEMRNFVIQNPKMALTGAAVVMVANYLGERNSKIKKNNNLQGKLIKSINQMIDGYNGGKMEMLRAIELTKAICKANIGFLTIYVPLREKLFREGDLSVTMSDISALAKATQDYKHISDSSL